MKTRNEAKLETSKASHTPTPWKTEPLNPYILGPDEFGVCQILESGGKRSLLEQKANAAFIVTACNAYADNLNAFKELSVHMRGKCNHDTTEECNEFMGEIVSFAIDHAEGRE